MHPTNTYSGKEIELFASGNRCGYRKVSAQISIGNGGLLSLIEVVKWYMLNFKLITEFPRKGRPGKIQEIGRQPKGEGNVEY